MTAKNRVAGPNSVLKHATRRRGAWLLSLLVGAFLGVHASPRCPGFRDSAARGSFSTCRRPMVKAYELGGTNAAGLIHIMADLDASLPSVYPAPASKVTTTLYAWLEADPLRSGSVSILMVP